VSVWPAESGGGSGSILLVEDPADPAARPLLTVDRPVSSITWSPDGQTLAYVTTLPGEQPWLRNDAVELIPVAGGEPTRWHVAEAAGIYLAGWWPDGQRILYWPAPVHSVSLTADGMPLHSLPLGATEPISLPTTHFNRHYLSWAPDGRTLLMVERGGRQLWDEKRLALCDVTTGNCRSLPRPEDKVSIDPAVSPDGKEIALVRADRVADPERTWSAEEMDEWVGSRTLWLVDSAGKSFREITVAGKGVYNPKWAKDGRHLVYIRDGALWVLDVETDQTTRVVTLSTTARHGYYGTIPWWNSMAWYQSD